MNSLLIPQKKKRHSFCVTIYHFFNPHQRWPVTLSNRIRTWSIPKTMRSDTTQRTCHWTVAGKSLVSNLNANYSYTKSIHSPSYSYSLSTCNFVDLFHGGRASPVSVPACLFTQCFAMEQTPIFSFQLERCLLQIVHICSSITDKNNSSLIFPQSIYWRMTYSWSIS